MRICYYNSVRIQVRKELNMGMSSYILDCEDKFWDDVVEIIKESDTITDIVYLWNSGKKMFHS